MNALSLTKSIPPMTPYQISLVQKIEAYARNVPQVDMKVEHFLHGGMYARTVTVPAAHMLTGALIKLETIVIVNGNVQVLIGDDFRHLVGYNVIPASKDRKQVFIALEQTQITMLFPTTAKTVKEAEEHFTDEWQKLTTRCKD